LTIDLAIGNGIYGWTSMKVGVEAPLLKHQYIEARFGGGFDIGNKIGFGLSICPYKFRIWNFKLNCDLTRVFGSSYEYISEKPAFGIDNYSFDNTNLIIPSTTFRIDAGIVTLNLTFGWAFGLTNPNIQHLYGQHIERHQKNINNRLIGGKRFEFGFTFRLRKRKSSE
jgi:hypothetical protein